MSGQRRTKAQKVRAKVAQNNQVSYSFSSDNSTSTAQSPQVSKAAAKQPNALSIDQLFSYDISLIYKDLAKTVVITIIMFCALIGLSFII